MGKEGLRGVGRREGGTCKLYLGKEGLGDGVRGMRDEWLSIKHQDLSPPKSLSLCLSLLGKKAGMRKL